LKSEKGPKPQVIAFSNTCGNKAAVMIKGCNTLIANATVMSSQGRSYIANVTNFASGSLKANGNILGIANQRFTFLMFSVFFLLLLFLLFGTTKESQTVLLTDSLHNVRVEISWIAANDASQRNQGQDVGYYHLNYIFFVACLPQACGRSHESEQECDRCGRHVAKCHNPQVWRMVMMISFVAFVLQL
jgi:preprotein translocase subunit SecG